MAGIPLVGSGAAWIGRHQRVGVPSGPTYFEIVAVLAETICISAHLRTLGQRELSEQTYGLIQASEPTFGVRKASEPTFGRREVSEPTCSGKASEPTFGPRKV